MPTSSLAVHDGQFSERLFRARAAQGYSRKEIEELTEGEVPLRTLMDWETKPDLQPRLGVGIRRVAEILGVTLPWLFWGEESTNGRDPNE